MSVPSPSVALIVEDEPLVRLVVSEMLIEAGFRVLEAADAAEALTILESGIEVDVLLADVDMPPGINGYELARRVAERWPAIEILLTSGRAWPGEGDLPVGAAFLAKPVPNEALVLHVQSAAERARASHAQGAADGAQAGAAPAGNVVPFPKAG